MTDWGLYFVLGCAGLVAVFLILRLAGVGAPRRSSPVEAPPSAVSLVDLDPDDWGFSEWQ